MFSLEKAFAALQISKSATIEEVKTAYKKLALINHPDRGGKAENFIRIRAAYEIVLDYYASSPATEDPLEVPIPHELRTIIDEIVNKFRDEHSESIETIKFAFSHLRSECSKKINASSIQDLQCFGNTFERMVNTTVSFVISTTNQSVQGLMMDYDAWFSESFREIYNELYARERFQFHKSKEFPKYLFLSSASSFLVLWQYSTIYAIICFLILQIICYFYNLHTFSEKSFLLEPANFSISNSMVQSVSKEISNHVREFQRFGIMSAVIGMRTGHPILGAIAAIGAAIASELTGGEKKQRLESSALTIMNKIESDLICFVSTEMEKFGERLNESIIENYRKRNENLVKLLTK